MKQTVVPYLLNPNDNGGEQVSINTTIYQHENGGIFLGQEINLQAYGNQSIIILSEPAVLTPEKLRNLADILEAEIHKVKTHTEIVDL